LKNSGNEERKEEKERHASWLELFHDLVFVAVVSQLSENLGHNISWTGLLSFIVLFIPVWGGCILSRMKVIVLQLRFPLVYKSCLMRKYSPRIDDDTDI
jgi:hypothetical protein